MAKKVASAADARMAELMAQTAANKASAAKARPKVTPTSNRIAPKVQPHQEASSLFGKFKKAIGVTAVEKALDTAAPKPKRNTRGW